MASKKTVLIKLNSTGTRKDGKKTGNFYTTKKNPKNAAGKKLELYKYDPDAYDPETGKKGKHVLHEEGKIK